MVSHSPTSGVSPIQTRYAGCHFRSRLEARWAVFFDRLDIRWEYEPEGFTIPRSGGGATAYLPDFRLPDCGTWLEVKGAEAHLDRDLLRDAARALPVVKQNAEAGPALMILGPVPSSGPQLPWGTWADWGWVALDHDGRERRYGFGAYHKNQRPWFLDNASADGHGTPWLTPVRDASEEIGCAAYTAARSARFEHGETGR